MYSSTLEAHHEIPKPTPQSGVGFRLCNRFLGGFRFLLLWQKQLRKARGIDGTEERRPRRQKSRLEKLHVEVVVAGRRAIHSAAALEYPDSLVIEEKTN